MVLDSSAIAAILFREAEWSALLERIDGDDVRLLSAATLAECGLLVEARKGEQGRTDLDLFLHEAGIEIVPLDAAQAALARLAWRRYGKGRHPAALNLGDCYSYALAKASDQPLLCKGDDFSKTDLVLA